MFRYVRWLGTFNERRQQAEDASPLADRWSHLVAHLKDLMRQFMGVETPAVIDMQPRQDGRFTESGRPGSANPV